MASVQNGGGMHSTQRKRGYTHKTEKEKMTADFPLGKKRQYHTDLDGFSMGKCRYFVYFPMAGPSKTKVALTRWKLCGPGVMIERDGLASKGCG